MITYYKIYQDQILRSHLIRKQLLFLCKYYHVSKHMILYGQLIYNTIPNFTVTLDAKRQKKRRSQTRKGSRQGRTRP